MSVFWIVVFVLYGISSIYALVKFIKEYDVSIKDDGVWGILFVLFLILGSMFYGLLYIPKVTWIILKATYSTLLELLDELFNPIVFLKILVAISLFLILLGLLIGLVF